MLKYFNFYRICLPPISMQPCFMTALFRQLLFLYVCDSCFPLLCTGFISQKMCPGFIDYDIPVVKQCGRVPSFSMKHYILYNESIVFLFMLSVDNCPGQTYGIPTLTELQYP